jgi:uncharacterized glyoxalase superfamily protein PhnB
MSNQLTGRVTPMIHVPDVSATVEWYKNIGFTVSATYGNERGGISFAVLSFGSSMVYFSQGGRLSKQHRREVDLYTYTTGVDDLFNSFKDRVEVIEGLHDTFYGMREFIIRDLNGFWITFAQDSAFGVLMNAIQAGNIDAVRESLDQGGLDAKSLTDALIAASSGEYKNTEIAEILIAKDAVLPPTIDERTLESYAGSYQSDAGIKMRMTMNDGQLTADLSDEGELRLIAIDQVTFRPVYLDHVSVHFKVEGDRTTGFELHQGTEVITFKRVNETT